MWNEYREVVVSGFSMENEAEDAGCSGFGEQRGSDGESPAGAGCGGAEQYGSGRQADVSIESDGLFEVTDVWGAGQIFGAWWSGPAEAVEQREFADA